MGTAQLCRLVYGKGVGRPPRTLRGGAPHKPSLRTGSSWRARRHAPNAAPQLAYSRRADAAEADDRTGTGSFRAVAKKPSFQPLRPVYPRSTPLEPWASSAGNQCATRPVRRHRQPKFRQDYRASDQLPPEPDEPDPIKLRARLRPAPRAFAVAAGLKPSSCVTPGRSQRG